MNLIENLQIGLLNAWIGPVIAWSNLIFMLLINPKAVRRLNDMSWYTKKDKIASYGSVFIMIILMVIAIGIPLKIGTIWFTIGVFIFSLGEIITLIATSNYGTTPAEKAITKGMYKLSRHPLYLGWTTMLLGISIASTSYILLILTIVYHIPSHFLMIGEERYCKKTYGKAYTAYCNKVPRYICFLN